MTEYLDAVPLDEMFAEARKGGVSLRPTAIVQIGLDLLEALSAVHAVDAEGRGNAKLIHGDLTPQSVLMTADGVAHLAPSCLGAVTCRLAPGGSVARLSCKAPEQIQGAAQGIAVDGRADLFALGGLLWGTFAGHRLFVGADGSDLIRDILSGSIPKLSDLGREVPPEIAAVIDRALERDREKRFADAGEMRAALETAAHSELADAFQKLVGERLKKRRAELLSLFGYGAPSSDDETELERPSDPRLEASAPSRPPSEPSPPGRAESSLPPTKSSPPRAARTPPKVIGSAPPQKESGPPPRQRRPPKVIGSKPPESSETPRAIAPAPPQAG